MRAGTRSALLAAALVAAAPGCGARSAAVRGDGGDDASADRAIDAGGDTGGGGPIDADGVGDSEVVADGDVETEETTWVLSVPHVMGFDSVVRDVEGGVFSGWSLPGVSVARFDAAGALLWSRSVEGAASAASTFLAALPDGAVVVGFGHSLVGIGAEGDLLWARDVEPSSALLAGVGDGSVIAWTGYDVMRYAPDEGVLWSRGLRYPSEPSGSTPAVAVTADGTVYLAAGAVLTALDLEGRLRWAGAWEGGDGPPETTSAAPTEDGGVVLAGRAGGLWAARVDREGAVAWTLSIGTPADGHCEELFGPPCYSEAAFGVTVGPHGDATIVGYRAATIDEGRITDPLVLRIDRDGSVLRALTLRNEGCTAAPRIPRLTAATALPEGGFSVAGECGERAILARLDAAAGVGEDCGVLREAVLEPRTASYSFRPAEVRLDEGTFMVSDAAGIEAADLPITHELLCGGP